MRRYILAVDLGGSKILTALVSEDAKVITRQRMETPSGGVEPVVDAIAATARDVLKSSRIRSEEIVAAGVGAPGPLDPDSGVVFEPPNLERWYNVPLAALLTSRLEFPVYVENDANAAAVGEWWAGAGRGASDLIYVTVSTGIGGGIIINDRLLHGVSGTAGEVGHMIVDLHGPLCPSGRHHGCLESLASGPAIARMAREALETGGRQTVLRQMRKGDPATIEAEDVAEAVARGDAVAREIWDRAMTALGVGVSNLLNLLNPQRIIIGGGVSKAGDLLFDPVRRIATSLAFERPGRDAQIIPAALGSDVGVVGAAAVALQRAGIPLVR